MSWTSHLADGLGCQEAGLKLVLGQVSGYPLFWLHGLYLKKSSATVQHLYFTLTGLGIACWAIGFDTLIHGTLCILITYLTASFFHGSFASTLFLFLFHIVYLFIGYVWVATESYDISWTMPHCVLCLRLIGLSIDIYDGKQANNKAEGALTELPSLLEMFSHCFFIGGYLVGPQFSMKKFKAYIQRNIKEDLPSSVGFGLIRFSVGCCYLVGHLVGSIVVNEHFVETDEFVGMSNFLKKSFYFTLWSKVVLAKYIAMWLFAEGSVILSGLAYNGTSADGQILWNGGANVRLRIFEQSSRFHHLIDSFNINTNAWVLTYLYKRLKFFNNRVISQIGTLAFLAVWHGYHSGYYITFLIEFLVINFEKQFFPMLESSSRLNWLVYSSNPVIRFGMWLCGKMYVLFFLPHCFLPFVLLKHNRYLPVMWDTYFLVFVVFGTWPLWKPLARWTLRPQK